MFRLFSKIENRIFQIKDFCAIICFDKILTIAGGCCMEAGKGQTLDMTTGRILPLMLRFAIPVMLGHLFQNVYNLVDMTVAGYAIGDQAIAAVSASSALITLINATAMGFNSGNTIPISQAFGAKEPEQARRCFAGAAQLCLMLAVLATAALLLAAEPLLRLVKTPAELMHDAKSYLVVMVIGLTATMLYNLLAGVFRAVGNSKIPLIFLVISSLLNIGLDILFMVPLGMGVAGAAWATVLAQVISVVLSVIYLYVNYPWLRVRREDLRHNCGLLAEMLPMGVSLAVTNSLFAIGDIAVQGAVNSLGADAIIAQAAGNKIKSFCVTPSIGMANTCTAFAAQNYGAGKLDRITKGIHNGVLFNMACNVVTYAVVFFFGGPIIRLITNTQSAQVVADGVMMLRIVCALIFVQTIVMVYRMSLSSMSCKVIPIVGTAIELVLRCFSAWVLAPSMGFLGICFAEPLSWLLSGAVMVVCYFCVMRRKREQLQKV